ncbi:MAG: hypothetical protein WHX53_00085 [Anaerolineae bacterium]
MATQALWSHGEMIPVATSDSREPALCMIGETLHLVWNANRMLYHARCEAGAWSQPTAVAFGEQPTLAAGPDGRLHCLFAHQFMRNYEIYEVVWDGERWSLPVNASCTYGVSSTPVVAVGADGAVHAAWADTTPGYSVIYYGTRSSTFWANRPVPGVRGIMPAIAVASDGTVFIAWSDRRGDTGVYDVFCTMYRDNIWSPPESVSDSRSANSLWPRLVIDARDQCHVVWQEEDADGTSRIYHADRRPNGWSNPIMISGDGAPCRLVQVAANRAGYIHAVWWDGTAFAHRAKPIAFDAAWREIEAIATTCLDAAALAVGISSARQIHLVWSGVGPDDLERLYRAERVPYPRFTVFLPVIAKVSRN